MGRRLGLPYRPALHNLRHGHATMLLQRGISVKVVQERLGHGAAAFTLSTNGHVLANMQTQAAEAVSAMLRVCTPPAPPHGTPIVRNSLRNEGKRPEDQ
jgi:integrase